MRRSSFIKIRSKIEKKPLVEKIPSDVHRTKIRVIGIGGGAGSIISEIAQEVKRVDFIVANTDSRSLNELTRKVKRFQFGQTLTKGLGTGMNDELGELAAQNEKERIKELFEEQDLSIIIACLGGGTSSGAAPVFAKISKNLGLTYGIFTLPFEFEGEKKMEIAQKSLEKIKSNLNVYSVIPNERIFQIIDKNTPLKTALSAINKKLAENLEGLIEMIYLPGLINIDFADLRAVLRGRGRLTYLNTIEIESLNKEDVVKKVISSHLYPYTVKGSRGVLYNINGGRELQLSEVSYISKIISESVNKKAKIIFGINHDKRYQNKIRITLLATGCGAKGFLPKVNQSTTPKVLTRKKIHPVESAKGGTKQFNRVKTPIKPSKKKTKIIKKNLKTEKPKEPQRRASSLRGRQKTKLPPKKRPSRKEPIKPLQLEKIQQSPPPQAKKPKEEKIEVKVRRNGLQVRKAVEEAEKEILEEEKIWETPAIFRKKEE